jgi:hypothetical protein
MSVNDKDDEEKVNDYVDFDLFNFCFSGMMILSMVLKFL